MSAPAGLRIVLLVGAEGDAPPGAVLGSESTPLATLLDETGAPVEVDVVSLGTSRTFAGATVHHRLDETERSPADRVLAALGAFRLHERFATFPVGRLLNSLGPVAPARVFWRTLRHHPEAIALLRASDVAIAADLETTKAAWLAVHRGWVDRAYYDHRALALDWGSRRPTST